MFTTVREELRRMAELRELLAGLYDDLASRGVGSEEVGLFMGRLAGEERQLATGLQQLAAGRDPALDAWVQFPAQLPDLSIEAPVSLEEALELANRVDEALLALCRPVAGGGGAKGRAWCDSLVEATRAREKSRATLLAMQT